MVCECRRVGFDYLDLENDGICGGGNGLHSKFIWWFLLGMNLCLKNLYVITF